MGNHKNAPWEIGATKLCEKLGKEFKRLGVNISFIDWNYQGDRFLLEVKLKGRARKKHLLDCIPDVKLRLKLPLLQVHEEGLNLYIVASEYDIHYPRLPEILEDDVCGKELRRTALPYFIGYDTIGKPVFADVADLPHLLLAGSSNSGKSVGLQALICTIAYFRPPSKVNLILIDVGANSLMPFERLPHLSHPIIRDCTTAYHALVAVKAEMERRVDLEYTNPDDYKRLPRLVLVIDEFPALFTGLGNKEMSREIVDSISSLLQRGRHAKIHLILAAQNPTQQNMKVDLGNIMVRIAFRCAKKNYSETILGEGGAEHLTEPGSLLLKSPQNNGPQWIQGVYIKPKEIQQLVQDTMEKFQIPAPDKFKISIPDDNLMEPLNTTESPLTCSVVRKGLSGKNQMMADVILWALGQNAISVNALMKRFHLGWNRASELVNRLEELGIAGRPEGKVPREVLPGDPEDIPDELLSFLQEAGHSQDAVLDAFCNRNEF